MKQLALALVLAALLLVLIFSGEIRGWLVNAIAIVQGLGAIGALLFVLLYVVSTVLVLPGSVLTIAAGIIYGPYWAAGIVLVGSVTGASLAFLLARSWLHPWVQSRFGEGAAFRTIAARTQKDGAKLVFLLRLSPIVPFSILNYLLGLTSVTLGEFVLASAVGMTPGILLYTHVGSTLGSLSELTSGAAISGGATGIVFWFGLGATLLLTIVLGGWSAQALRVRKDEEA